MNSLQPFKWSGHDLYRIKIVQEEDNYLHAVCRAYFIPYMTLKIDNHIVTRHGIIETLKRDLLDTDSVSNQIRKNIFHITDRNVYCDGKCDRTRPSIVLLYDGSHYDVCAYRSIDGTYVTHFPFDHPLIRSLHSKVKK